MLDLAQSDWTAINCTISPAISRAAHRPSQFGASQDAIRHFLTHSLSANSKRAYAADIGHFKASGREIPSTPQSVAAYLAEIAQTHAVATIQRRLVAIAKAHRALGHVDPCQTEIVKAVMRGIRRTKGAAQREAQALQRDDLFAVLAKIGDRSIDRRDRALLLIGFAGAFRRSELVGLNLADVQHVRQGIVLNLRRSKTDQTGQGRKIAIPHGRTRWCPVKHLTDWIDHASIAEGPLFRSIDRHGRIASDRLSGDTVSTIIKKRLSDAGFDPASFSGHSLRAGFATSAAMAGASSWKIRQQTGHASDAMLARYVRLGDLFVDNAAAAVL